MVSLTTSQEAEASALGGLPFAAIPSDLWTGTPGATVELKLKQASAVLGVSAKELQNLVQLKVIRPPHRDNLYWFDRRLLLEAEGAFYLKESLGSSSELLSLFTDALSRGIGGEDPKSRRFISLRSLPPRGRQPIEIRIPLSRLAREVESRCRDRWLRRTCREGGGVPDGGGR